MALSTAAGSRPDAPAHEHTVVFYEHVDHLTERVAGSLLHALDAGGTAVVVAGPEHGQRIQAALVDGGFDAPADRRYVQLDAADVLRSIMVDGAPDPARFTEVIGQVLTDTASLGHPIHVFGEMVALLWDDGRPEAALDLEELWNELLRVREFSLLCGYPLGSFGDPEDADRFAAVIDTHAGVIPTDDIGDLQMPEQARRIAMLQQRAMAHENQSTRLRTRSDELEDALERMIDDDRMRRRFAAMVAHDVQTPVAVIAGMLELLGEDWADLEETQARRLLDAARRNVSQISRLLDDVLVMARLETGHFTFEPQPMDLTEVAARVVAQTRDASGRQIRLSVDAPLPDALADEGRQLQILHNLIGNAVKFSDRDIEVCIELDDDPGFLRVAVCDRGPGIDPAHRSRLFEPFARLPDQQRSRTKGTGLGLYITKALAEGQGGRIAVAGEPGQGTTVTYTVPVAPAGD